MKSQRMKGLVVGVVALCSSGCYGAKLVKGPINSYQSRQNTDSLLAVQGMLVHQIAELQQRLDDEREERLRSRAETGLLLEQLDEAIRILSSQVRDADQRSALQSRRRPRPTVVVADTASTDSTGAVETKPVFDVAADADALFDASYADLTQGKYDLASQGFTNYLVKYPDGERLDEVHYSLGESYYARGRHYDALGSFQNVARDFPKSRLVAAAYLKTALCYSELEETRLAERMYRKLVAEHPNTEEAGHARAALDGTGE